MQSMQLLVFIMRKIDNLPVVLSRYMDAGISGTTILDCEGALQVLGQNSVDQPPIFGSLRSYLNPSHESRKMLLTVLSDEQLPVAKQIIRDVVDIDRPDTGIMFTLPLTSVEGLAKKTK